MLWQLTSNNTNILKIDAADSGEAEQQLTMLGVSMTWLQGTFRVTGSREHFFLQVYGAFGFSNHYELKPIK